MDSTDTVADTAKRQWEKPELQRLGTLRDIAGRGGFGTQSGPNARASKFQS